MRRFMWSIVAIAVFATITAILAGFPSEAMAQEVRLGSEDAFLKVKSRSVQDGRIDIDTGIQRALYDQASRKAYLHPGKFLDAEAARFGFRSVEEDLELVKDDVRENSRHLTYQQTFAGLPVDGRLVRVNMDREGRVSMVLNGFTPVDAVESSFDIRPSVGSEQATSIALNSVANGKGAFGEPTLMIARPDAPVLAWQIIVWPEEEPAEYNVLVDAQSGEVIQAWDQAVSLHGSSVDDPHESSHNDPTRRKTSRKRTDGSGFVFDPDPLFLAGVSYGAPYSDGNDRTNAELDAARKTVTLRDISQDGNGDWVLNGPYARIVGSNTSGSQVYNPPKEASPDGFFYDRSENGFEAVVAYYHIDKSQRYIQQLGITDIQNNGLDVNPQGVTRDDSFYYPSRNLIVFGTGGVDDGEDPAVVVHEYGHAILNAAAPGLLSSLEGRALHEGFADYWTGSYTRWLVETGQTARDDWRWVFLWDSGEGSIWNGRYLDHFGQYPQDVCVASGSGGCSVHNDGRMWATTLMEVWDDLGREVTDHLVLLSHYYLQAPVTFADAAEAVIQADFDYYGGQHAGMLIEVFSGRGLVDASAYGPVISHEPLLSTDQVGVTLNVDAIAIGSSSPIVSVELVYSSNSQAETTVNLAQGTGDNWFGDLVLPAQFDTVSYYIHVVDDNGNEVYDPPGAPGERHSFLVGNDQEPPSLDHVPPQVATFVEWPISVSGTVTDKFGIEAVTLSYKTLGPTGSLISEGSVVIAQGNGAFDVGFPASLEALQNGGAIIYHLTAMDGSVQQNVTRLPAAGEYFISVQAGDILRNFDLSAPSSDLTIDGGWEIGAPSFGSAVSPSGAVVLATNADGVYSASAGLSSIILPTINLGDVSQSYLRFWHWVDTEHVGEADPTGSGANLIDGGVVRYRSSSNDAWEVLTPVGGYPGIISSSATNPLAGLPAFGGFGYAWRRVTLALPAEDGLQLRLDFATDDGNTETADQYAGWLIDGLALTTVQDQDAAAPVISSAPSGLTVLPYDRAIPDVMVEVSDDLGVTDVWMDWTLTGPSGPASGEKRLTQHPEDLNLFVGVLDFLLAPEPGDKITYTLTAGDPTGNEGTYADRTIEFRLFGSEDALESIWATGGWQAEGVGWLLEPGSKAGVSSLVLDAQETAQNALALSLVMDHEAMMGASMAGLVEVSTDDGANWHLLEPQDGYPGQATLGTGSVLDGRPAFVGSRIREMSVFPLDVELGSRVQVRIVADISASASNANRWMIYDARFESETDESTFEVVTEFGLQPNFPNPFSQTTRIMASVAESGRARMLVYDTMGRQVAVLWDGLMDEGTHGVTWDASMMPAGVYYMRFSSGGKEAVQTLIHIGR